MIWIQKGSEPASLTLYRCQPHSYYDGYSHKDELREALLRDQGYLCAYCMRRIRNDRDTMKIEHWKPQSKLGTEAEKLDFQIMLGVCDGCRGSKDKYTTCDEHRHESELHINPLNKEMMETISYDRNGKIKSSVTQYNKDLVEVLILNCEQAPSIARPEISATVTAYLRYANQRCCCCIKKLVCYKIVENRRAIYEECMKQLIALQKAGKWKASTLRKILQQYEQLEDGQKQEYAGVPIYLIQKYLKRCQG